MEPPSLARKYPSPDARQATGSRFTGAPGAAAALLKAEAANSPMMIEAWGAKIGIISCMLPRLPGILLRLARSLPLAVSLPLALSLALSGCSGLAPKFTRPNITVISVQLRSGNLLQQSFAVKLNIQNPNDRELPVRGLHTELNVGGDQIASGVSDRAIIVPAFGDAEFDMTIKANLALAMLKLADKANQHADSIDYDITGVASIDLPFLRNLPFHQTGSFSLKNYQ
jgi:LEA14-like dessication related protein